MAALDFACAASELDLAREAMTASPIPVKATVYRLSAEVAFSQDRQREAEAHLRSLLEVVPDFAPAKGAWPPSWVSTLERIRSAMPDRLPPRIFFEPPAGRPGEPVSISVRTEDRSGVGGVSCHVLGRRPLTLQLVTADGQNWTGNIPGPLVEQPAVLLWIEATDLANNGPATAGDRDHPLRIPVTPAPRVSTPLTSRWWFWTAIGAAAAGAGLGTYFGLAAGRGGSGHEKGGVKVEVGWPKY
jgi:hypothetical protein